MQHIRCDTPNGSNNLNTAHHAIMSDVTKTNMAKKTEKTTVHMEEGGFWDRFKIKFKKYMENPEGSFFSHMFFPIHACFWSGYVHPTSQVLPQESSASLCKYYGNY